MPFFEEIGLLKNNKAQTGLLTVNNPNIWLLIIQYLIYNHRRPINPENIHILGAGTRYFFAFLLKMIDG